MKLSKEEIRDWLLENAVNKNGDLNLKNLDFSDFEGDVYFCRMKVKGDLYQNYQNVGGDLHQHLQIVEGDVYQGAHVVGGFLTQSFQNVKGSLYNRNNKYGGDLYEEPSTKMLKKITVKELAELGYELV